MKNKKARRGKKIGEAYGDGMLYEYKIKGILHSWTYTYIKTTQTQSVFLPSERRHRIYYFRALRTGKNKFGSSHCKDGDISSECILMDIFSKYFTNGFVFKIILKRSS